MKDTELSEVVFDPTVHLNVSASPVLYGDDARVAAGLSKVIDELEIDP